MFSSRVTCEQALIISALVRVFLHPPESIRRQEVSKGSSTLKISPNPSQLVSNLAAGGKTRRLASLQACSLALEYILIEKELKTRRRSISSMFTILGERLSQKKHLPPLNNKRLSLITFYCSTVLTESKIAKSRLPVPLALAIISVISKRQPLS